MGFGCGTTDCEQLGSVQLLDHNIKVNNVWSKEQSPKHLSPPLMTNKTGTGSSRS